MIQKNPGNITSTQPVVFAEWQQRMRKIKWEVIFAKHLGLMCGIVLAVILVAGLWPFRSPKNDVTWLAGGNGLLFGRHATILSTGAFKAPSGPENAPCTIEIWLEPNSATASATILAFYAPDQHRQFSLRQSISDLALTSHLQAGRYRTRLVRFYVDDIFRWRKPVFITITANQGRTSVYIDGALAKVQPSFPLAASDFGGDLVIANSPTANDSWSGSLRGLAFYDQELAPAQVRQHYATWAENGRPTISENEHATALYLFDERAGRAIHNEVPSGVGLYIPERYRQLHEVFFEPFWREFTPNLDYCEDVLINIAGFIPVGWFFFAYFSLVRRIKRPALTTILLGFLISLTIESLQGFLPTRNSGTTDLMTNTLGTCVGVWLYRWNFWRILLGNIWAHLAGVSDPTQTASK